MKTNIFFFLVLLFFCASWLSAISTKTYTTDTDFLNFSLDGIQVAGSGDSAKMQILHNWQNLSPSNQPSARHSASLSYDNSISSAVLFGGVNSDNNALQDTWVYEPLKNTWTQRFPSPLPSPRFGHKMVNIGSGTFLLFGGQDAQGNVYNDTWIYNCRTNSWAQKNFSVKPSSRSYQGMCFSASNNKVYMFGGINNPQLLNDFWSYNVAADSWSQINTAGIPAARYGAGMCFNSKNNSIILTCGRTNIIGGQTNDLWMFPTAGNNWQNISQTSPNKPGPVSDFVFEYMPDFSRCFLFGGYSAGFENTAILYNPDANEWSTASNESSPSGRESLAGFIFNGNTPYIFGGNTGSANNETWKYLLKSSATFVITITTSVPTSAVWLSMITNSAGPISSSTTVKYQIANSEDGVNWGPYLGYNGLTSSYYSGAGPHTIWPGEWDKNYLQIKGEMNTTIPPVSVDLPEIQITYNIRPYPPQVIYPPASRRINTLKPVFAWSKATDVDGDYPLVYHLQAARDNSFNPCALDVNFIPETSSTNVTYSPSSNLAEGQWYWRLNSQDQNTSNWTSSYIFYIDTRAPSNVTNLSAETGDQNGEIHLIWVTPGDDGTSGEIVNGNAVIRYTTQSPIISESDWNNAPGETVQPFTAAVKSILYSSVRDLQEAATYFLAMKVQDPAGNISTLSVNNPSAFTNAPPSVASVKPPGPGTYAMLKEISWAYNDPNPGDTETAAIKISSNGGNSYVVLIASGLADKTTHYIWNTRRVCNGDDYKLKIIVTDWRGLSGEAVSGGIFSIFNTNEPPELNLIYPTGGEILSGRVTVQWVFSDVNLTDIHDFDLSYSTNNGDNYTPLAYLQGDTTSYFWDTVLMNNATNYLLKIIAVESNTLEKYTAQSVSGSLFTLDNGNKGPSQFRLLLPEDKQSVNLLKFELEWEKNGDPNPEDTIYYTLYYSTDTNFSNFSFVQLMDNRCILTAKELSEDKVYYWRVEARDQFNSVTVSSSTFSFFVLNHNKALSKDKTVLAQASAGMPDGGFLFIEKVDPAGYSSISAAKDYSAGDRLMKVVSNDIYKVEVMDINQQVIEVENVTVNISFKYNDEDNDGYLDGTTVPVDKLKIAIMDGNRGSGKWIFPMDIQSIDKVNKQVSARSDKIYLFSLLGSNVPEKLLSNINVFPNPFAAGKENVRIRYVLKNNAEMDVKIYNLTGDLVKQWKYGPGLEGKSKGQQEGLTNEIQWNGENGLRNVVANGMYLCVIDVKTENEKQREIRNIGIVK